jgi:Lanthionine synthetase C-like protein
MLFSPDRHEPLSSVTWNETKAREAIARIVQRTHYSFSPRRYWPSHPLDTKKTSPQYMLYWGACGVLWALRYLEKVGATQSERDYTRYVAPLVERNKISMGQAKSEAFGSYMMGDTSIQLLQYWLQPSEAIADEIARLVEQTIDHPAREIMWGAPGTLLAALRMHQRTGEARWATLYQATARKLWSQLEWSQEHGCHYWTQSLYGQQSTYLDAVHGFVATAVPLIQGRHLLPAIEWDAWQQCIANTVRKTAEWEGDLVNWRARLSSPLGATKLVQFCHGAPGFVICLADLPDATVDDLLIAGGETTWRAGPLNKGSNLCHGTGGNGYAFLKLYRRFNDAKWLERARAFAMHGIAQTEADLAQYGHLRYSLWTGDLGFAIYLWDCILGGDRFPTLDTFFVD